MARKPDSKDVALDEDSSASWYASADLTSCSDWDEQDPELYRMMAAPRPAGSSSQTPGEASSTEVVVEVEDTQSMMDAFEEDHAESYQIGSDGDLPEDFDELETVLPDDEVGEEGDAMQLADEESSSAIFRGVLAEWRSDADDEVSWVGRTALQLGAAPRWMSVLGGTSPRRERTPRRPAVVLVPAYELQCGVVEGEVAASLGGLRSSPTRIARRLWQRDLERLGL